MQTIEDVVAVDQRNCDATIAIYSALNCRIAYIGNFLGAARAVRRVLLAFLLILLCAQQVNAVTVDMDTAVLQALQCSHDLRMLRVDQKIAATQVKEIRADYFPDLNMSANTEFVGNLTGSPQNVAVVGNMTLPATTRYQGVISFNSNYLLTDFGVRANNMRAARSHALAAHQEVFRTSRDLKLRVIELYTEALLSSRALKARENALPIYHKLFGMKKRLYDAGTISKIAMGEEAIRLAEINDQIQQLKQRLADSLKQLSVLTQVDYDPPSTELMDVDAMSADTVGQLDLINTPEHRFYALEIDRKRAELIALKRKRMPQIAMYSNFVFYGSGVDGVFAGGEKFGPRIVTAGLSLRLPIFDGFRNKAQQERCKWEIRRLQIEADKKKFELAKQHERLCTEAAMQKVELATKAEIVNKGQDNLSMWQRLSERQITDQSEFLNRQVALMGQEAAVEAARIQRAAVLKKLKVLTEG